MPDKTTPEGDYSKRASLLIPHSERVSLSRSPHPYRRRSDNVRSVQDGRPPPQNPSPESISRAESTESGTEADDERGPLLRSLPAPPLRSHKGLRGSTPAELSPAISPLPTPPATLHETLQETFEFFGARHEQRTLTREDSAERKKRETYIRRKKGEIFRRGTETILLGIIAFITFSPVKHSSNLTQWLGELIIFVLLPPLVYALYPLRKVHLAYKNRNDAGQALASGFHIPSRFDPGPLLYPVALPVIVAVSLAQHSGTYTPVNFVCGLSSVPLVVSTIWHQSELTRCLRWIGSILPFHLSGWNLSSQVMPTTLELKLSASTVTAEDLVLISPLHDAFKSVLQYTTTTSLDPAELELLATAMINLLLLSQTPQAELLKGLLWVGGLSLFISCRHLLSWEIELARIPKWKLARRRQTYSIVGRLTRSLSVLMARPAPTSCSSDDDLDSRITLKPLLRVKTLATPRPSRSDTMSATTATANGTAKSDEIFRRPGRRSTISTLDPKTKQEAERKARNASQNHSRSRSQFLSLTLQEAKVYKYLYAAAVYALVTLAALGPVRTYISMRSLHSYEPFGWAIGYLFGDLLLFRDLIHDTRLDGWVPVPTHRGLTGRDEPPADHALFPFQAGNLRLLLCGYCLTILFAGIATVLTLTSYLEVDTRRKGFHGVMVLMLLPTIFMDPCFFALALALILAAFLLLDLFRASQLPPISRPLTHFLAPYVDGRDHRGPVIVSHIFLLIGCAIPLWLSLAGLPRLGMDPWDGWDVPSRDLSMVSGVVCVGMGDAAASLVGRRFGKTKWYWGGGKSLEGSFAFATAVTVGLMFGHTWLRVGGWLTWDGYRFEVALTKCIVAGMGASLLESVLTAANDNVVVPIGLWLLVRGLQI